MAAFGPGAGNLGPNGLANNDGGAHREVSAAQSSKAAPSCEQEERQVLSAADQHALNALKQGGWGGTLPTGSSLDPFSSLLGLGQSHDWLNLQAQAQAQAQVRHQQPICL